MDFAALSGIWPWSSLTFPSFNQEVALCLDFLGSPTGIFCYVILFIGQDLFVWKNLFFLFKNKMRFFKVILRVRQRAERAGFFWPGEKFNFESEIRPGFQIQPGNQPETRKFGPSWPGPLPSPGYTLKEEFGELTTPKSPKIHRYL